MEVCSSNMFFLLEEAQSRPLRRLGVKKDLFMGFYMTKEKK